MRSIRAIVIKDGECEEIQLGGLEHMQKIVGGRIEAVSDENNGWTLWRNEEGKLEGLPLYNLATTIWWRLMPRMVNVDVLCGPVIATGGVGPDGETLQITDAVALAVWWRLRGDGPLPGWHDGLRLTVGHSDQSSRAIALFQHPCGRGHRESPRQAGQEGREEGVNAESIVDMAREYVESSVADLKGEDDFLPFMVYEGAHNGIVGLGFDGDESSTNSPTSCRPSWLSIAPPRLCSGARRGRSKHPVRASVSSRRST